ncbi:MAG: DUF2071 domain-containing protein [Chitinophagaceae bacterium]
MAITFLSAEWRKLAIANYAVDPQLLLPHLPYKTELDTWNNTCYVSLVGFMFVNTRLLGLPIPFHINFEEINLRFYVRSKDNDTWKRGVVFIKEIVPRPALTFVANTIYKENYETLPTQHLWVTNNNTLAVEYKWKKKNWHSLKIMAENRLQALAGGSEEEFITEHYWGYARINDSSSTEYEVQHPRWEIYPVKNYEINVDFEAAYGAEFAFLQQATPRSVFLAEGSPIKVKGGKRI